MVEWQSGLLRLLGKQVKLKDFRRFESFLYRQIYNGSMAERFIALVLKTSELKGSEGSNPSTSANFTMVLLA